MKLVIGLPWYMPDSDCFPLSMDQARYYGGMEERTKWFKNLGKDLYNEYVPGNLAPADDPLGELTVEDLERMGELEIAICNASRVSLVGRAREIIVDMALDWDADFLLWWDADMRFQYSSFLRLWRHDVPVVGALAFTARHPFQPVLYRIRERFDETNGMHLVEGSDVVLDYPKDQLVGNEQLGGELAMGGAVMLYNMNVFKEIPKPWFSSTGCGEDWFFCHRCSKYNIARYMDTSVKTQHKEHIPRWADEESYWREREELHEAYVDIFGENVRKVKDGELLDISGKVIA